MSSINQMEGAADEAGARVGADGRRELRDEEFLDVQPRSQLLREHRPFLRLHGVHHGCARGVSGGAFSGDGGQARERLRLGTGTFHQADASAESCRTGLRFRRPLT